MTAIAYRDGIMAADTVSWMAVLPQEDIPLYWSAGGGRGWPQSDVLNMLQDKFGFPDVPAYIWPMPAPLMVYGPEKKFCVVVTCDEEKAHYARLLGAPVAYLPVLMGPSKRRPFGYEERYGSCGDPWLCAVQ